MTGRGARVNKRLMLPIGDDNSDLRITPFLNYALIGVCIAVFLFFQEMGANRKFTYAFVLVPQEIMTGKDIVSKKQVVKDPDTGAKRKVPGLQKTPISVYITLITSIFMHGSIAHLIGNMLFLFIFGDNLEGRLGRIRYFLFYLCAGILASLAHVFTTVALSQSPLVPCLGASGAISGVLAGYLVMFPRRRVKMLLFRTIMEVPAYVAIGIWFAFQIVNGLGMLGGQSGGIAYGAHIGGFIAGLVTIKFFAIGRNDDDDD